jgi:hypothetical protein
VPSASGASSGTIGVKVVGASPRLSDDVGNLLELDGHGAGADVSGNTAIGDPAPTVGSSSAAGPGASELYLSGFLPFRPRTSTGGRWGMRQSLCVHRLPPQRGCCMRH